MLRILIIALLFAAAHFSLTAFAPAHAGSNWLGWPFAADSKPWLSFVGGLPQQSGSAVTPALAGIAGLCFLAAGLALTGWLVPANWWQALVLSGTACSAALFLLYFGPFALIPLGIDALLLWGLFVQYWTVASIRG